MLRQEARALLGMVEHFYTRYCTEVLKLTPLQKPDDSLVLEVFGDLAANLAYANQGDMVLRLLARTDPHYSRDERLHKI